MLRPSAAPRWKIATRTFLRCPVVVCANAARSSQSGDVPTPTMAMAESRRKIRLDIGMFASFLPSLKVRRAESQARDHGSCGLPDLLLRGLIEPSLDCCLRGGRCIRKENISFDLCRVHRELRQVHFDARDFTLGESVREIHSCQQRR